MDRPVCVLMAALGGQGGGVLVDWLVAAARINGLEAQATSIPGVAQRTGATTYYFEVYPQSDFEARPVFSIFPASGAIDLMVSFEPMEAARALSNGYISSGTTVITAGERIFSTFEKIKPGDGITPLGPLLDAMEAISKSLNIVAMSRAARSAKCHPNAVMFGAMVASGILPMNEASCRQAISQSGVAVERNLAGYEAGRKLKYEARIKADQPTVKYNDVPAVFSEAVAHMPEAVQAIGGHGVAHILDYQNRFYGDLYLQRLKAVILLDNKTQGYDLSQQVARRLAQWMAFEDIIRVAQLKTRPGRFARIRKELGVSDDVPLYVHDFLKPGMEELRGILPRALAKLLPQPVQGTKSWGIALKVKTSGPIGWAMMRFLSSLKFWRMRSARFAHENAMIEQWLDAIRQAAVKDYQLALKLVDIAVWARGYGETRERGFSQLNKLLENSQEQINLDVGEYSKQLSASLEMAYSVQDNEPAQHAS